MPRTENSAGWYSVVWGGIVRCRNGGFYCSMGHGEKHVGGAHDANIGSSHDDS